MSNVVSLFVTIIIALFLAGIQKYLSTRKHWQLGAILPIVSSAVIGILYYIMKIKLSTETVVPFVMIIFWELCVWIDGRHKYKQEELKKMKAKDI